MESNKMAEIRQNNAKKPHGKQSSKPAEKEIVYVDGHKKTVIRGDKVTIYWKGMEVGPENHSRPRVGKTARDNANGAKRRNYENKQSRVSWQHDGKRNTGNFPYNSCNGKRNRTVVTAKGNERKVISYKMVK
jgi:hypothetical protein